MRRGEISGGVGFGRRFEWIAGLRQRRGPETRGVQCGQRAAYLLIDAALAGRRIPVREKARQLDHTGARRERRGLRQCMHVGLARFLVALAQPRGVDPARR
jgi:hypothetical protein